jgi:D-sedoheptulose 7-phosphate isomerase
MRTVAENLRRVSDRVRESIEVKRSILEDDRLMDLTQRVAELCVRALNCGAKLILFGNGGSAADAQHLAAELTGRYLRERRALPAIALTTNTSCLTAIGNDYSYDQVFSRQIEGLGKTGDIAIGISTSGNSKNVILALRVARKLGLTTIGMTGTTGGILSSEADYCLCIPSDQTPRIQEAHILLGHILCELIEESFADERNIS